MIRCGPRESVLYAQLSTERRSGSSSPLTYAGVRFRPVLRDAADMASSVAIVDRYHGYLVFATFAEVRVIDCE